MKNLVLLSQVFHPNTQSTSLLLTDLVLNLQDADTKVTVICGFPNSVGKDLVDRYEKFHGVDIYRCGINVDLKKGLWQRLVSYASYLTHAGWKLLWLPQKDTILGVSNPPFLSIVLMIVSILSGCRYYFIMHDVYPEGLVALGKLSLASPLTKLWCALNRLSYKYASAIIVLGRDMQELLVRNYAIGIDKVVYIPNWSITSTEVPIPFESNSLAQELNLQDKFVVQYSGNMGLWHDIDTFIRAAAKLSNQTNIKFLFIGNGIRLTQAQQLSQELELQNVIWMDFVPKEKLSTSLSCAHVSLISLNLGLEGIAVPCKLYGILGAGRAILAQVPNTSEIAYTVLEEECGFVVAPGNVDELVERIILLEVDRDLTDQMGHRAFQAYQSKYTVEIITKQFKEILHIQNQSDLK
jgi:colanic acid biosynthesis glycosyl transferase WcaI